MAQPTRQGRSNHLDKSLEIEAANPAIDPGRLRDLAANHSALRPLIAMNPAAYPGLLDWLASLNDPAVNVALQQRKATENAQLRQTQVQQAQGPQRVSVLQRGVATASPASTAAAGTPSDDPAQKAPNSYVSVDNPAVNGQLPRSSDRLFGANPGGTPAVVSTAGPRTAPIENGRGRRITLIILTIALGLLAIAAVALVINLLKGPGTGPPDTAEPASMGQAESAGPSSDEDSGDDDTTAKVQENEIRFPAPSNALEVAHVMSPSGNITCMFSSEQVRCTILSYSFTDPSIATCSESPVSLDTTDGMPSVGCSGAPVSSTGATALSYDDYAKYGDSACYSTEFGISCWNTRTGSAFAVAREGFVSGTQGKIEPSQFPWVR